MPGELKGLEYIHNAYGKLPWPEVIAPAIKLARYGFPVSYDLACGMDSASRKNDFFTHNDFLTKDLAWAMDFAPNGTRLGTGIQCFESAMPMRLKLSRPTARMYFTLESSPI